MTMSYTLPERNEIVTKIGQLEVELNLSFSLTHNKPTAELEAKLTKLQEIKQQTAELSHY